MTENSENLHMLFFYHIDWHIFFPEGFDNFDANQDTLLWIPLFQNSGAPLTHLPLNTDIITEIWVGCLRVLVRKDNGI